MPENPQYPTVAAVPPNPGDLIKAANELTEAIARVRQRELELEQQAAAPHWAAHTPPSVSDIGAFIAASGVAPENVGPLVAKVQAKIVGAMVEVIGLVTGEIVQAHRNQMAGFAAILQGTGMVGFGSTRDALVRLLLSDPSAVNDTLLAARYDGRTDWRDALPTGQPQR